MIALRFPLTSAGAKFVLSFQWQSLKQAQKEKQNPKPQWKDTVYLLDGYLAISCCRGYKCFHFCFFGAKCSQSNFGHH